MGWLSRTFGSDADHAAEGTARADGTPAGPPAQVPLAPVAEAEEPGVPAAPAPAPAAATQPPAPTTDASSPMGRYGPLVTVTRFDTAPPELEWQLPLNGELYRLIPGADRPDYSLLVLDRPLHFYPRDGFDLSRVEADQHVQDRKGRTMVRVHALLLCARFVGQQLHPGMTDLSVNLAYVIDNSLARDAEVDFGKIEFAGIGFLSEGHTPVQGAQGPSAPVAADQPADPGEPAPEAQLAEPTSAPEPAEAPEQAASESPAPPAQDSRDDGATTRHTPSDVLDELARTLRRGIEEQRGAPVHRMTAAITVDPQLRLTGLSGNADGQAPVPTADTFGRMAEVLGRLADLHGSDRISAVTLRVDGDVVSHEVTGTHA